MGVRLLVPASCELCAPVLGAAAAAVAGCQVGKLCATPFGIDVVGITEVTALIGALVGGITARKRKDEVERLNEQLRSINLSLRQQARAGTVYAPGEAQAPQGPCAGWIARGRPGGLPPTCSTCLHCRATCTIVCSWFEQGANGGGRGAMTAPACPSAACVCVCGGG